MVVHDADPRGPDRRPSDGPRHRRPLLRTPDGFLRAALHTRYIGARITAGDLTGPPTPRWSAAHGLRLEPYGGRGWIAAGDAALAFDPLSSQGILTALHSGARAGLAAALCLAGAPPRPVLAAYTDFLDGVAAAYVRHHAEAYAAETRWPELPFWQRRGAVRQRAGQGAPQLDLENWRVHEVVRREW